MNGFQTTTSKFESSVRLEAPEHETITLDNFKCIVVEGKGLDLIFQFFDVKFNDFMELIAEVVEEHFGNTDGFAIEYVRELGMFGLLAKDIKDNPLFSKDFHIHGFLNLLNNTITELQE